MPKVVYESNAATVGDGVRITRVSDSGQTLEVMVDPKTERFSRIVLIDPDQRTIDTFTSSTFTQPGDAIRAEAAFHREFIEDMEPDQQIAYLLEVIEIGMAADRERYALIKDHVPKAARRDVQMLSILWEGRPRIMTYGAIAQRIEWISGSYPDDESIRSTIKRLRRALEQTDHPIDIIVHYGIGYSLSVPDGWQAPWETDAQNRRTS